MNHDHHTTFRKIGDVLARQVMPPLHHAARFPLRVSYVCVASFDGCDEADGFERVVDIGLFPSPEEAMCVASERVARGDEVAAPLDHGGEFRLAGAVVLQADGLAEQFGDRVEDGRPEVAVDRPGRLAHPR